ncbi:chemotaxis protein CheX [Rubripirellula obstinata]|uniref:chemotaxis protein CheX n=1 Tax=Rubripirellula obstinata TaxID=406547 RepID=UPI00135719F7|nr:chemotaxis protein CheX [Rubripirellula obstinata]
MIDSIDESIREVFEMMADAVLVREGERCRVTNNQYKIDAATNGISVVMGLTGGLKGSVSLSMSDEAAMRWATALIDHQASEIDETVLDAIGELGNMVVGGAKRRLSDFALKMSLPSVIRVGVDGIAFPQSGSSIAVGYQYAGSTITVLTALQAHC